ncbi:TPA: hypothetical protein ACUNF5_000041 [Burkholderia orbicola]|uniref:hypothetical protein n=1 Tax=Burkholderia cenocepacia TaxID=95486 RepID=UPI000F5B6334|nr:hypothetical protein [Burkholderia cenocepacia]
MLDFDTYGVSKNATKSIGRTISPPRINPFHEQPHVARPVSSVARDRIETRVVDLPRIRRRKLSAATMHGPMPILDAYLAPATG